MRQSLQMVRNNFCSVSISPLISPLISRPFSKLPPALSSPHLPPPPSQLTPFLYLPPPYSTPHIYFPPQSTHFPPRNLFFVSLFFSQNSAKIYPWNTNIRICRKKVYLWGNCKAINIFEALLLILISIKIVLYVSREPHWWETGGGGTGQWREGRGSRWGGGGDK
jgi:hypothetical protein